MSYSYKPALLYQGPIYWYVYYYYLIPGTSTYKRLKEYLDINRIKDKKERLIYGKEVVKFLNLKLTEGFNPFKAVKLHDVDKSQKVLKQLYDIVKLLNLDSTQSRRNTYMTRLGWFERFLQDHQCGNLIAVQVDVEIANKFKDYLLNQKLAKKKYAPIELSG